MASKIQTCIDKLSIKRDISIFSKPKHREFDASHAAKIANLCQILYGDLPHASAALTTSKNTTIMEYNLLKNRWLMFYFNL